VERGGTETGNAEGCIFNVISGVCFAELSGAAVASFGIGKDRCIAVTASSKTMVPIRAIHLERPAASTNPQSKRAAQMKAIPKKTRESLMLCTPRIWKNCDRANMNTEKTSAAEKAITAPRCAGLRDLHTSPRDLGCNWFLCAGGNMSGIFLTRPHLSFFHQCPSRIKVTGYLFYCLQSLPQFSYPNRFGLRIKRKALLSGIDDKPLFWL
jgi:hypothetical protein